MTRYLITGGAAFIGSHIVEALLARGDEVPVLHIPCPGRLSNLDAVRDDPQFSFVQGSVLDERAVDEAVRWLFNTVGPRQSPACGMVIQRFVPQALAGEPLTVIGDGTQSRCFCHVTDVIDALGRLLDEPQAVGDVFNVGGSEEISIRELADLILRRTESLAGIVQLPP